MNAFEFDQARLGAATGLPPEHFDEFQRLSKTLVHGPPFQLVIVDCTDERLRKRVLDALDEVLGAAHLAFSTLSLDPAVEGAADLEAQLVEYAQKNDVVHVFGASSWFDDSRWDAFNARRERVAQAARARLVFWLAPAAVNQMSAKAPDLWAWRSGVYTFEALAGTQAVLAVPRPFESLKSGIDSRSKVERARRISELRAALDSKIELDDELRMTLLDELAELHMMRGDFDGALRIFKEEMLPIADRLKSISAKALVQAKIGDILQSRGQSDEALRIFTEEVLPIQENLGDVRSKAITQSRIASILQERGFLEEAMRLLVEEVLPTFDKMGDVRSQTDLQGRIADVFHAQGNLEETLRIRKEMLPVYDRLGDLHSKAITQAKIANILRLQGRFDEALHILEDEVLPIFERLGDVRSKAVAEGQVAEVLQTQGRLDQALCIWKRKVLPTYQKLGDVRECVVCMTNIAIGLHDRNAPGDRVEAEQLLTTALADASRFHLAETSMIDPWLERVRSEANG